MGRESEVSEERKNHSKHHVSSPKGKVEQTLKGMLEEIGLRHNTRKHVQSQVERELSR